MKYKKDHHEITMNDKLVYIWINNKLVSTNSQTILKQRYGRMKWYKDQSD